MHSGGIENSVSDMRRALEYMLCFCEQNLQKATTALDGSIEPGLVRVKQERPVQ